MDGGGDRNACIRRRIDAGTYMVVVYGTPSTFGGYTLIVEPDNTEPVSIGTLGETFRDTSGIDGQGQRRIYEFSLDTAATVTIDMMRPGDEGIDSYLELQTAAGEEIARDDDGGEGLNARLTETLEPGAYRVIARGYSNSSTGDFILAVSLGSAPAEGPEQQERQQGAIGLFESRSGNIPGAGVRDSWTITIDHRTPVAIHMDAASGSGLDAYLALRNQAGTELQTNDDGGEGRNSLIATTLDPGEYTIVAYSFGSTSGDYVLRVDRSAEGTTLSFASGEYGLGANTEGRVSAAVAGGNYNVSISRDAIMIAREAGSFVGGTFGTGLVRLAGPDSRFYGLVLRAGEGDQPDLYTFEINGRGQYRVRKRIDGRWSTLTSPTHFDAIRTDAMETNALHVEAADGSFALIINGRQAAMVQDGSLTEGCIGIAAENGLVLAVTSLQIPRPLPEVDPIEIEDVPMELERQ